MLFTSCICLVPATGISTSRLMLSLRVVRHVFETPKYEINVASCKGGDMQGEKPERRRNVHKA